MKNSLLILSMLLLAGCVSLPISLTKIDKATPLTGVSPALIVCPPDIEQLVEKTSALGLTMQYETGKVFSKVFAGMRTDQPHIELVDSNLSHSITDVGFTGLFFYRATIKLHSSAGVIELTSVHTRKVHGFEMPDTSVKITVETVVADLLQQANAHL